MVTKPVARPPMYVVGWMIVVAGDVMGIQTRFHHGLWRRHDKQVAEDVAKRWQATLIRTHRNFSVSVVALFGKADGDLEGVWQATEAAVSKVRNVTHVEMEESP